MVSEPSLFSLVLASLCLLPQSYFHFKIVQNNVSKCGLASVMACQCTAFFNTCYICWWLWLSILSISIHDPSSFKYEYCIYNFCGQLFLLFSKLSIYMFYILRLRVMFGSSIYQYNPKLLCSAMGAIVSVYTVAVGPMTYAMVLMALDSNANIDSFEDCQLLMADNTIVLIIMLAGVTIAEIIAIVIVLRLYLSKLILLSIRYDQHVQNIHKDISIATGADPAMFFHLSLKITNTLLITTISTVFIILLFPALRSAARMWMMVDCAINTLSLYLSFDFGKPLYDKLCCCQKSAYKCCAKICFSCCFARTPQMTITHVTQESKIASQTMRSETELESQ
eukprot:207849_1